MIEEACMYTIRIRGHVDEREVNATSPVMVHVEAVEDEQTRLAICTDQSGVVGLIRHLHGLGFVLLSVRRAGEE